jgi:hypothetical protein
MKHLRLFESWLHEASTTKPLYSFDLLEEMPDEFSVDARLNMPGMEDDEDIEYTEDIATTLEVHDATNASPKEGMATFIHKSFKNAKHPVKLLFTDTEKGYGQYGPNGGGMAASIYAGLDTLSAQAALNLFMELWDEEPEYFVA